MSDMKAIHGQAGIVSFSRSISLGSLLVLTIVYARLMGPETFGAFQQVFIFNALFLILTFGIPDTLYYFLPRLTVEERPRFLGQTLLFLGFAGILCTLFLYGAAPLLARYQHNPAIVGELRLFGIYGAFFIAASFADPICIVFGRFHYLFILNAVHSLFLLGLTGWYYVSRCDFHMIFFAMAVFGVVKYLLALSLLFRMRKATGNIRFFTGKGTLLLQLSFAIPVMLTATIDIIARWLDKYVVSFFFGPEALGVFFVGAIEIPFVSVFISSVYSVVSPVLSARHSAKDIAGFTRLVNRTTQFTMKLVWPVFVYFLVFADHIIPLVFKEDYGGAVTPFRIYLLMLPLRVASYGVIVIALGRPRAVLQCALLALAANTVLNIVLAYQMGYIGPAAATVVSTFMHVAMLLMVIVKELDVPLRELIPFRQIGAISLVSIAAAGAAFAVTFGLSKNIEVTAVSFVVFSLAYLAIGGKTGLIRFSDFLEFMGAASGGKKTDQ